MRHRLLFAGLAPALAFGVLWACNGGHGTANATDAAADTGLDADVDADAEPFDAGSFPDVGTTDPCTFDSTDPIALCVQQQVLGAELQYAYTKGQGVAPGWSSVGPSYSAVTGHSWQDDLGLAGALGAYYCGSEVYGNTHSTASFNAALADLGSVLSKEMGAAPAPYQGLYDGEIYFRMRWAQAAFAYVSATGVSVMAAAVNAYAAGLAAQAYSVAGDAGVSRGTVIGTKNADGTVTYAPAQSVMAAAALLDFALQNANAQDAGPVADLVATAQAVLSYVLSRGRDPATGLFYQSLTTSAEAGHDTPAPATPTSDSMLTDTQAWIVLGLARAEDSLDALQSVADAGVPDGATQSAPYATAATSLVGAMTAANLFDGTTTPPTPPAAQPVGAFMEGTVLSNGQLLTNKTTAGNAILLGGLHRAGLEVGSAQTYVLGQVRSALTSTQVGQGLTAHENLLSIVTDTSGNVTQQAYLRAGSKTFGYALAYSADGGDAGEEQGATNYTAAAVHAMVEGFTQLWRGSASDTRCAP